MSHDKGLPKTGDSQEIGQDAYPTAMSPSPPHRIKTGAQGGQRSEVKGEGPAQPEPEDMSGVGHPAPLSLADLSQPHPPRTHKVQAPSPAPQIRCTDKRALGLPLGQQGWHTACLSPAVPAGKVASVCTPPLR